MVTHEEFIEALWKSDRSFFDKLKASIVSTIFWDQLVEHMKEKTMMEEPTDKKSLEEKYQTMCENYGKLIQEFDEYRVSAEKDYKDMRAFQNKFIRVDSSFRYLKDKVNSLYSKIEHGDEAHRKWLKDCLDNHFKNALGE